MFRQMNIRKRLLLLYTLMSLVTAGVGGFGAWAMRKVTQSFELYAYHVVEAGEHIASARTELANMRRYEKDIVIHVADAAKVKEYTAKWEASYQAMTKSLAEHELRTTDFDAASAAAAKAMAEGRRSAQAYHDTMAAVLPKLAGQDVPSAYAALRDAHPHYAKADQVFSETLTLVAEFTQRVKAKFVESERNVLFITVGLVVAAWLLLVVVGRKVSNSIVGPLRAAQQFAGEVRDGNLTGDLPATGRDEAAELARSLVDMQTSLQVIVGNVRMAADSIQTASSEVASGNADLSHRTEQTAASLQQTASAINELTATVEQTADSARTASQLAGSASTTAERGGAVVGEVVTTMERINSSSRRIGDIIGTIDGIAFQTNILALNAAVEAARAGEAGRGFAVVASEVRSLAQRSAEAAREIKSLIGASVESVEAGTRLVADAGSTMSELVASVQRVTDIIGEISSATGEQSSGIGSVNTAVAQLDQATQQNAALVEQSAAAAQSLRDQAHTLAQVVSTFRLPGATAASPPSAAKPAPAPARAAPLSVAKPTLKAHASSAKAPPPKPKPTTPSASAPRPAPAPAPAAAQDDDWETF